MNIENIRLINFRNYRSLNIELNKDINIFLGKNAQGKTNLLEAIYMCTSGKSFRTNRDKDIINLNKDEAYIGASFRIGKMNKFIEIKMERNKQKRIRVNKIELKNFRELNSGINMVVFSPDDLKLIKDGPMERRIFLDTSISQLRPVYKHNINRYNKILFQRNNLLKSNRPKYDIINLLEIFDLQLAKTGTEIIMARAHFIDILSKVSQKIHENITYDKEELELVYKSNLEFKNQNKIEIEKDFLKRLKLNIDRDLATGNTEIGPHRDDMDIKINHIDAKSFASQGQQRTVVLSIKLAEVDMIKMEKGLFPILLLDDVYSELDLERRRYLTKSFNNTQTMITSTDIIDLEELQGLDKKVFYIEDGRILD